MTINKEGYDVFGADMVYLENDNGLRPFLEQRKIIKIKDLV